MTDGHHKETAEVAKANREPIATPFPPAEAWSLLLLCVFPRATPCCGLDLKAS